MRTNNLSKQFSSYRIRVKKLKLDRIALDPTWFLLRIFKISMPKKLS